LDPIGKGLNHVEVLLALLNMPLTLFSLFNFISASLGSEFSCHTVQLLALEI
jgi:hypothetical protein